MRLRIIESWPELDYMPDSQVDYAEAGWQSVAELQAGLKSRFTGRKVEKIENGVRHEEIFQGHRRVFQVTLEKAD